MPRPRRTSAPADKPTVKTRGQRRAGNGKGAAPRVDEMDAALRVLADLDYDPNRTTAEEAEARIVEIETESTDVVPPDHVVHISDILADLIAEGEDDAAPKAFLHSQAAATAFEDRSLEVALTRGSLYLEMTAPLVALSPDKDCLVRRTLQGRAILASLSLSRQAGPEAWTEIDDALLEAGRRLAQDLTGRLPAAYDVERPAFPAVSLAAREEKTLRRAWEELKPLITERNALVVAARAAWHVGAELVAGDVRTEA